MLSIAAAILLISSTAWASCGSFGTPGRTVTWHANTDSQYNGGDAGSICGCLDILVNIESCNLEHASPDGKSA
ncbi:hypothetical protein Slin15195_G069260 [Septoria linicola]|uniref:Uncharacterized protein n=1 Tax=Septoria linicola TaxID=215465 RepID=A0A9Q9AX82_9PEZI|nr:hypothetical protein Slin15195_G069260 [Septoria linicola]